MSDLVAVTFGAITGMLCGMVLVTSTNSDAGSLTKEECERELKRTETCTQLWFPSKKEGE